MLIRDLRREPALAPGGARHGDWLRAYLPLVYGAAAGLAPADLAADVTLAVFRSFSRRWRRLPGRTVMAVWLLRSAWFATARRWRGAPAPSPVSPEAARLALFRGLERLPAAARNAVVLGCALNLSPAAVAQGLRRRESSVVKQTKRGLAALAKRWRNNPLATGPAELLAAISQPAPPELELEVLRQPPRPPRRSPGDDLEAAILRAWTWRQVKRAARRVGIGIAASLCVLAVTGLSLYWLGTRGYLTAWFIRHANSRLVEEFPELGQPARPYAPAAGEPVRPPATAPELYTLTHIWPARLTFTPEQWRAIAPARIPPAPSMMKDGAMVLRNPAAKRSGLAGVVGLEFNWTTARLEFAGGNPLEVAVRYRGNGTYLNSLYGPKQSFKVDLNKRAKGQNLAGVRALNFVNAIPDNSYLRDALAEQLFRELGAPGPLTGYAYLTVETPGLFGERPLGLYVLVENIDADFAARRFGSKATPIFKPVTPKLFAYLGDDWRAYAEIYDLKTKATPEQLGRIAQFARLVTEADDAEFARRLPEFLDLEAFAAFLAGHVLLSSYDGFLANGQNLYLYLEPRGRRFGFIPWDQDHAWGEFGYVANADRRERASIWQPAVYPFRFLDRVLQVAAFRAVYRQCLERALAGPFSAARLNAEIDRLAAALRPAVAAESAFRLRRFDQAVSDQWLAGPRDPSPGESREGPKAPVHQLKRFIAGRVQSVRAQLDGKEPGEDLRR